MIFTNVVLCYILLCEQCQSRTNYIKLCVVIRKRKQKPKIL